MCDVTVLLTVHRGVLALCRGGTVVFSLTRATIRDTAAVSYVLVRTGCTRMFVTDVGGMYSREKRDLSMYRPRVLAAVSAMR